MAKSKNPTERRKVRAARAGKREGIQPRKKPFTRAAKKSSPSESAFISAGTITNTIDVGLSYKIVELFSEGLYASANKAFEELVTNSFDAGALNVNVILPSDPTAKNASIIVVDDGEGMNALGLEELWQIGATQKRLRGDLPRGRSQIGKFGIGKLATYVLANRLTYISKSGRKYYATSMDYTRLDSAAKMGVVAQEPIKLEVHELTATEAKTSVEPWTSSLAFQKNGKYLSSENKRRNLGHSQFCRL